MLAICDAMFVTENVCFFRCHGGLDERIRRKDSGDFDLTRRLDYDHPETNSRGVFMYGTIATLKIDPANTNDLAKMLEEWSENEPLGEIGYVAGYLLQLDSDPSTLKMVAVFKDEGSFRANAARPEQDAWYQAMRAHLLDDPTWDDGNVIATP